VTKETADKLFVEDMDTNDMKRVFGYVNEAASEMDLPRQADAWGAYRLPGLLSSTI
jgi:hypothetical protein